MPKTILPARNEVPFEETWNIESIFSTVEDWQTAYEEVKAKLPSLREFEGTLEQGPKTLLACLTKMEETLRLAQKVIVYGMLASSVDVSNQDAAARSGQGRSLMAQASTAAAFVEPELMAIGFETLFAWLDGEPDLAIYRQYLEDLERKKKHVRSSEVEEVLAMAMDPLNTSFSTYNALTNADLEFEPACGGDGGDSRSEMEVGQSSIRGLITHDDREVRRTAWENYADGYLAFKNTLAGVQTGAFKQDVFNARARRYDSSLEASLFPNNIPTEVFHNLIEVFKENLPTWHRYWRVRREALGYDQLHVYDIKAPLVEAQPQIPYRQAVDWICEGMAPLGEEYVETLRKGCLENRWVDRSRNKGKRKGAFSGGGYDTQPFILMSYADDVFSLSTLAHELGHSLHSYLTRKNQPFVYGRYSLFVAEVASNFNQAMVRDYLFRTQDDPTFQLALIEETMSNFHRYFFIMPTLARYELEMHQRAEQGAPINAQSMTDLTADLFEEGYGEEIAFDHDRIGITWAQFGHMYMNFYVYQYATGISGAHALADRVLAGEPNAAEDYLDFLKAGSSAYPLDALKAAGVDLTTPEPVEKAFASLAEVVDRLEELVG
ncbi:MAG: Oligoendopeptidase F, plasmid [Chloroflexi bacterium]|nr:Oligoendopeptidase F, plasmid [Chloroflexota bacterium]